MVTTRSKARKLLQAGSASDHDATKDSIQAISHGDEAGPTSGAAASNLQDDPSAVAAKRNMEIQSQLEEESNKFPNQLRPLEKVLKQKAAQAVKDGRELDEYGVIAIVADKGLDVGYKAFAKIYERRGLEDAKELKRRKIIFGQALLYELRGSELFNVKSAG